MILPLEWYDDRKSSCFWRFPLLLGFWSSIYVLNILKKSLHYLHNQQRNVLTLAIFEPEILLVFQWYSWIIREVVWYLLVCVVFIDQNDIFFQIEISDVGFNCHLSENVNVNSNMYQYNVFQTYHPASQKFIKKIFDGEQWSDNTKW